MAAPTTIPRAAAAPSERAAEGRASLDRLGPIPHLPALDGLRGIAVIGVLLFHAEFAWAGGGFLGVSTFFTLSGFLITNLLIREHSRDGRIDFVAFWARRFRRLLPAALVALAGTTLLTWLVGSGEQLRSLRGDVFAALGNVANWRFLSSGASYSDLFAEPSPLQHFWSLAIEEQFYVTFPLVAAGALALTGRRGFGLLLAVAAAAGVAWSFTLANTGSIDRTYDGTDVRAVEILVGAVVAIGWAGLSVQRRHSLASRAAQCGATVAFGLMLAAWAVTSETSNRLASGGFAMHAVLVAVIIVVATAPGPLRTALAWRPLRAVGAISYGLYLYHWPIFVFVDHDRTGLDTAPLFLLRMALTVTVALASYRFVETPLRHARARQDRTPLGPPKATRPIASAVVAVVAVAALAVVVTLRPPAVLVPFADADVGPIEATVSAAPTPQVESALDAQPNPVATADSAAGAPDEPIVPAAPEGTATDPTQDELTSQTRPNTPAESSVEPDDEPAAPAAPTLDTVMIVGDSGMFEATPALVAAYSAAGASTFVRAAGPGFGLSSPVFQWRRSWTELVDLHQPELAIVMLGAWDAGFIADEGVEAYLALMSEAVDILSSSGARVAWVEMLPSNVDGTNRMLERPTEEAFAMLADRYPQTVLYVDTAEALAVPDAGWPRSFVDDDGSITMLRKPDGWHLCPSGAERVADAISSAVGEAGLAPEPQPGWQEGSWRSDPLFDDPPGACLPS